jgi:YidC/Oxa1 family membrane protein insertase
VFLALYQLLNSQGFKDDVLADPPEGFLFIPNLTEQATGAELVVLILLFIGTQMGAGLVMSSRVQDRNQRLIMFGLPFLFAPFVATFPAGLAVYWIATNLWTLGQQWVVMTFWPPPALPAPEQVAAAKPPPPPPRKRKRRR